MSNITLPDRPSFEQVFILVPLDVQTIIAHYTGSMYQRDL